MKLAVIGAGYVGLVTGTCFAEVGHEVRMIDSDPEKLSLLQAGTSPIYEPGLDDLLQRNLGNQRLSIHSALAEAVQGTQAIFLALPTPAKGDGSTDLRHVLSVIDDLKGIIQEGMVVVSKSTVPVGTTEKIQRRLKEQHGLAVDVVANPEFLSEGHAIKDALTPSRIVVGTRSLSARRCMEEIYAPFTKEGCPLVCMSEASAEIAKYAANAFLATRISFINEIAGLCAATGADISEVAESLGHDPRIGKHYTRAGLGYGGSCLPKDLRSLHHTMTATGLKAPVLEGVMEVNAFQATLLLEKAKQFFEPLGGLKNRHIALWGLSFKPETDDIREATSLLNLAELAKQGCILRVYDPVAMQRVQKELSTQSYAEDVYYAQDPYDALKGTEAVLIMTEWRVFSGIDLKRMHACMKRPVIFDGRNIYEPAEMKKMGFHYESVGRGMSTPV